MGCISQVQDSRYRSSEPKGEIEGGDSHRESLEIVLRTSSKPIKKRQPISNGDESQQQIQEKNKENLPVEASFITLQQLVAQAYEGGQEEWDNHNSSSGILKLSKKVKNGKYKKVAVSRTTLQKNFSPTPEGVQIIDCVMKRQADSLKLSISLNEMQFEFSLPTYRGGPLVVPFINYDLYSL